jgi:hypothetical protein
MRSTEGTTTLPSRPRLARMGGVAPRGSAATGRACVLAAGSGAKALAVKRRSRRAANAGPSLERIPGRGFFVALARPVAPA